MSTPSHPSPASSPKTSPPPRTALARAIADATGPWRRTIAGDPLDVFAAAVAADGHPAVVRVIAGRRATTVPALFDELSAALQFPPTFGRNWDAALDALRDARDRQPGGLTLVVLDAPHLLAGDAAARSLFDRVLEHAHSDADDPKPARRGKGFRVVLHGE